MIKSIKHLFFILVFLSAGILKAQTTDLIYHLGSAGSNVDIASVATDANGNIFVCGSFTGALVEFNPLGTTTTKTASATGSGFIASYDVNGILKKVITWGTTLVNKGLKVYVDPTTKNVYLIATVSGSVNFTGSGFGTASGSGSMALVKYDNALTLKISKVFISSTTGDLLTDISFFGPNLYLTGALFSTNVDFNPGGTPKLLSSSGVSDILVAKYDTTNLGNIWAYSLGAGNADAGNGIDLDNSGNVFLTGYFTGQNVDIDPVGTKSVSDATNSIPAPSADAFVAKYDATTMACQWAFNIGAGLTDRGDDILVDKTNGDVFVGGIVKDDALDVYFDPTTTASANFSGIGLNDIFVASYTSSGATPTYNWHLATGSAGEEELTSLAFDLGRNIVLSGFASGNVNFGSSKTITGLGGRDAYFAVISNTSGLATAAYNLGGASNEQANSVTVGATGKILVVGSYTGTGDYNLGAVATIPATGTQDGFISRHILCTPPSISGQPTSLIRCEGTAASFTVTATGATSYQWKKGATNIAGATTATYSIAAVTLAQAAINYSVEVTNACQTVTSSAFALTVNPKPNITSAVITSSCSGTGVGYTITSDVAATYSWTRAAKAGITPITGSGATNPIVEVLTNGGSTAINVDYIIIPTATTGSCVGDPFTLTVTVNPKPAITSAATGSVCSGVAQSYLITSNVASSYNWSRALVSGVSNAAVSNQTSNPITETLTNNTASPVNIVYIITPQSTIGSCTGAPYNYTVTVNPALTPTVSLTSSATTICAGTSITLTATPTNGGSPLYKWKLGSGYITGATNAMYTTSSSANGDVYSVEMTSTAPCASPATVTSSGGTITVNSLPTISGTLTVCLGLTTQLTGSGTAAASNAWVSGTPSVATVSSSGLVTAVGAGTSVITYTNNAGCPQTATVTVTASPTITGTLTVCVGLTTQLTGSGTAAASNAWVSGIPSVATVSSSGLVTGVAAGTSVITYTNNAGCSQTATVTVTASPTITGTLTVCLGSTTQLTGSGTAAASNAWVSGTPSVATVSSSGLVTGVAVGTSIITYTNNAGCSQTATVTVAASPTISGTLTVCFGLTTILTGTGTPDGTTPWVSANTFVATVSNTGFVTGMAAGTSVITYKNNNGCTKTATVTVTASPTITGILTVCVGLTTQLTGSGTAAASNAWVSATPSVATVSNSGLVIGVAAGTSVITYTNNAGCSQTATVTVTASPTITGTLTVCLGSTTQLTGSGTAAASNAWVSGTPSVATVSSSGLVTGVAAGTSVITYTNNAGCSQTATVTVTASPTITGTLTVCLGSTTQLTGSGTAAASNAWVSATPSVATVSSSGLVTGVATGTSVITYTNNAGCSQTATVTVTASPTITGTLTVCLGSTTQLTGSGTAAASNAWVSGTPSVATVSSSGLITGVAAGTSVITYTNNAGCTKTATVTVTASPTITGTLTVCVGLTTQLTGSGTAAASNAWVSATPSVATVSNSGLVTGVAAGTSVITYTNNAGCSQAATVSVSALPTISGNLAVCIGSTTTLIGSGTASASNPWISTTTSVATVSNVGVVTGVATGTSVITYTNNAGCTVTATVIVSATAAAGVTISTPFTSICDGMSITLTANPTNGGTPTYKWKLGSGYISGATNATYTTTGAVNNDSYTVEMTSSIGCASPSIATSSPVVITVNPTLVPTVSITTASTTICLGDVITFTSTPINPGTTPNYVWYKNGSPITPAATGTSYSTTSAANGDKYKVVMTSNALCASPTAATSNEMTITVRALPTITGITTVCEGATVILNGSGTANASSPWISMSTSVATVNNSGVVTGQSVGTSIITYTNSNGCSETTTITVNETPTISGTSVVCMGSTTQLTGTSTPASSNAWVSGSPGKATVDNTGLVTGIASGTSVITYTTNSGCTKTITVTVNGLPTITGTATVCVGSTTQLSGSTTANASSPWISATPAAATVSNTGLVAGLTAGTSVITYTNSNGCVDNQTVTVNATSTPDVSITANNSTICAGTNVIFTAMPISGGTTPTYKWKLGTGYISGATNATYATSAATDGESYSVEMTSNAICASTNTVVSNAITISVTTSVIPSVTIAVSPSNSVCVGASVTFTATPGNGGTNPTYQWKNGSSNINGATNATFTSSTLVNGDQISVNMVSNSTCASTFNAIAPSITMVVKPMVTAIVALSASSTSVCTGESVSFTTSYTNEGTTPVFEWFINTVSQGAPSSVNTFSSSILSSGDQVLVKMTSSLECVTTATVSSNAITITVTPKVTPIVSITSNMSTICTGGSVMYTATPVNGGTASYQWKINNSNSGLATPSNTFTASSLTNGDVVKVELTSSVTCVTSPVVTSNGLTIIVAPATQIVSQPGNQSVCAFGNNVTFSVGASGGNLSYQWKVGSSDLANNSTYSGVTTKDLSISNVSNADLLGYSVVVTGTCGTVTSNTAILTQSTGSISIATQPVNQTIQEGNTIQLSISASGPTLSYQWKKNGVDLVNDSRISGANTASLQISNSLASDSDNNYTCLIMSPCASSVTSNASVVTITTSTSIQDAQAKGFRIAPNPSSGYFTLSNEFTPFVVEELEIVSMQGIVVARKTIVGTTSLNEEVNAQDLPKGIYLLIIKGEGEQALLKIVF